MILTLIGSIAFAAPTAAPMSKDEMGTKIAAGLAEAMGMDKMLVEHLSKAGLPAKLPDAWAPLAQQAALDEYANDKDAINGIMGKAIAAQLTDGQLAAGVAIVSDPRVMAQLGAKAKGEAPPTLAKKDAKEVDKILAAPDAASFLEAMKAHPHNGAEVTDALIREFVPGFLVRFGTAAEKAGG